MEQLLWYLAAVIATVTVAALHWYINPVRRVLRYEGIGYVLEYLVFGFFTTRKYLSNRKNKLDKEVSDLKAKLKKAQYELDLESKRLEEEVKLLDKEYRNHLYDSSGKRGWRYLWRQAPFLDSKTIEELKKDKKDEQQVIKGRVGTYTLPPGVGNSTGWSIEDVKAEAAMRGRAKKLWFYVDPKNMGQLNGNQQQQSRKQKGGANNQQQNNQQHQQNNSGQ